MTRAVASSSRRRRRRTLLATGATTLGVLSVAAGAAAQADDPPNATGPCEASATLDDGTTIDPYASSGVFEIPLAGSATYEGQIGDGSDRDERSFSGEVVVKTPPGLPDIELTDAWTWDGSGTGQRDAGSVDWDLPSVMPRGVPFKVEGFHQDDAARCEGYVNVKIEGGLFDSPLGPAALGGTALALVGMAGSMIPKRGGAA